MIASIISSVSLKHHKNLSYSFTWEAFSSKSTKLWPIIAFTTSFLYKYVSLPLSLLPISTVDFSSYLTQIAFRNLHTQRSDMEKEQCIRMWWISCGCCGHGSFHALKRNEIVRNATNRTLTVKRVQIKTNQREHWKRIPPRISYIHLIMKKKTTSFDLNSHWNIPEHRYGSPSRSTKEQQKVIFVNCVKWLKGEEKNPIGILTLHCVLVVHEYAE